MDLHTCRHMYNYTYISTYISLDCFRKSKRPLLPEPCQKRSLSQGEGLRRRPKAYAEGLQEGEVPREGGREGGRDSRECCCQSPVRGEGLLLPKAEGLQEGEVPREGGDSRGKRADEFIPEGGRKRGDSRGKRAGESIPDGWRPEASPPPGLDLSLSLTEREREGERERERERQKK